MSAASASHEAFASIAAQLREGRSVVATYELIVDTAPRVIEGCDRAAIGILEGDRFRTGASSDDVMRAIDKIQNELGEGPCLEASTDEVSQLDNDITTNATWPRLARRVVAETPVRSMLAIPLVLNGQRGGALNIFADRTHAFTQDSIETGAILAAFASVAICAARQAERADQLQQGLATNREIGAAIGILMASRGMTSDEAFAVLSQASQRLNRKLRDIAVGIVRGERPAGG
jgi:transcriptional regulator with GAF, ATPase, and Fis domain